MPPSSEIEPDGVPENENVPSPPIITFRTITVVCFLFRNVHVTVSPASTLKIARRFAGSGSESESSHEIEWRSQPSFTASVVVYWPGATVSEIVPPSSEIEPDGVPE